MFHKIGFHSGHDPNPSQDVGHNPAILSHKTNVMSIMNEQLNSGVVCDAMIATVLILQLQYVGHRRVLMKPNRRTGQPWIESNEESEIHFSGLTKLIQHRGGLENLPLSLSAPISLYVIPSLTLS
jgi:hypothetical protein